MNPNQVVWIMVVVSFLLMMLGYALGYENANMDMLASCKGEERGIHLRVHGRSYFYFCSYVKQ